MEQLFNNFLAELQKCEDGEHLSKVLASYDEYDEEWNNEEILVKMLKEVSKKGKWLEETKAFAEVTRFIERIKHLRNPNHPICCLCNKVCECKYGNNPAPLATKGRCCHACNRKVIEKRIESIRGRMCSTF
jgi:hypothetical protein